ncbi:uncharacterized protein LOC122962151 [Acropora millepora]|uniref:uncharacterized protein LOC122962151 n=1 Tax=Acropora millepora TaxID=45264 RepID=UPI001CF3AF57|nr:uncharacterized protein LOC122962151 [Acropora millepora]
MEDELKCHFTLHLSECPEKAVKCFVKGCHTVVRRKEFKQHLEAAASSHSLFQQGEIQRLRRIMHFKARAPSWTAHEDGVFSFCWKLQQVDQLEEAIKSTDYRCPNGNRWRGLIAPQTDQFCLSIQLICAVVPVLVGIRIVLMPRKRCEKIYSFPMTEVKEGQVIGKIPVVDIAQIISDNGYISIKFVMCYYQLKET